MGVFETVQIRDSVYHIYESLGVFCTLIVGRESALLIDTGYGFGGIRGKVRAITSLPLKVINTHGHVDHIQGNKFFDEVMLHRADRGIIGFYSSLPLKTAVYLGARKMLSPAEKQHVSEFFMPNRQKLTLIDDGCTIDLGGRVLEVIHTPGHTEGSVCILDREERMLYAGDSLSSHVWLFLRESAPLPVYIESLKKLEARESEFDTILSSHSAALFRKTLLGRVIHCAEHIDPARSAVFDSHLAGKGLIYCEGFERMHEKYGFADFNEFLAHSREVPLRDIKDFEMASIVYSSEKLRGGR